MSDEKEPKEDEEEPKEDPDRLEKRFGWAKGDVKVTPPPGWKPKKKGKNSQ